jgi:hypothetical protein
MNAWRECSPFFVFVAVFVVIVVVLFFRYRRQQLFHQERMAALDKGLPVPQPYNPAPWSPRVYLLRGLLWSFGGIALSICIGGIALTTQEPPSAETIMWRAKNLTQSAGISMEEAKQIIEKDRDSRQNGMPVSVALLGLIPIAVGAAYLIFYYTGKKGNDDSRHPTPEP